MSQMGGDWGWLDTETELGTVGERKRDQEGENTGDPKLCGTSASSELGRVWAVCDTDPSAPGLVCGRVTFSYHTPSYGLSPPDLLLFSSSSPCLIHCTKWMLFICFILIIQRNGPTSYLLLTIQTLFQR